LEELSKSEGWKELTEREKLAQWKKIIFPTVGQMNGVLRKYGIIYRNIECVKIINDV
jgi:hypothetical protein